ncbi:MAG TPA: hypothetical protein PKW33_19545 [Anaerolineaceae bacterium]|nr:hypothetical protein [Anaerolineaceae bacterium]HPN53799.1 hypothetical protein [Anaerolineaceae bacterium]
MNENHLEQELLSLPVFNGIILTDVMTMPVPISEVIRKMIRQNGMSLEEFSADLSMPQDEALRIAEILVQKGILVSEERERESHAVLRVFLARLRGRSISLDL